MSNPAPVVVANIKSNQTWEESQDWINTVGNRAKDFKGTIIYCPSYPFLSGAKQLIDAKAFSIKLGAQDISKFNGGAYTGAVAASQIKDLVEYAIIGHSERRKHFGETNENVFKKVELALENNITPILCISDISQLGEYLKKGELLKENWDKIIFVFEPPSAISGGGEFKPDDPEDANKNAGEITSKIGKNVTTIYGGSINDSNVKSFFSQNNIHGGLVGQASVKPDSFLKLIENATI
ncbi:hypothetical protein A3J17_01040 [Candidatus Curtissbacteria bacterium RIFCSPLOWO2_02_FULL_40_11]|nr:MAG: hypothetical protein A3J17_01040 [Candidatus Curtissbacteria bacterium RIFCSPLOWO2_02_FULL_40_11]